MAPARNQAARLLPSDDEKLPAALADAPSDRGAPSIQPAPGADEPSARHTREAPQQDVPPTETAAPGKKLSPGLKRKIAVGAGAVVALALIYYGLHYMFVGRYMVSTDDAYVRANNTTLGARVAGHIASIGPSDNSRVGVGNVIFRIDDGDYQIAVANARAKTETQQAIIERIGRQMAAQESTVEQAKAQVASADAGVKRAEADFARQQELSGKGFASKATFETSQATRDQAVASVQAAQATFNAAQTQIDVIKAQKTEAESQLQELRAALAKATRDLSFTTIRAPIDGIVSNRIVNIGDYVQPGQRLAYVVPIDEVFIDANFKETQVKRLKPGQPVTITVDAISGRTFKGIVDTLAPAAGSVFTLLPPDNATGNFTKIVQRIPVRIRVPMSVARENLLRPGMSVIATVNTKGDPDGVDPIAAR